MGSEDNRLREKWQDYSGTNAGQAEKKFIRLLKPFLKIPNGKLEKSQKNLIKFMLK